MTTNTKPSDILQSIADVLLGAPEFWTTGAYARNANGKSVSETKESACRWCASGFTFVAGEDLGAGYGVIWQVRGYLMKIIHKQEIPTWNDKNRTVGEVQAAFQRAANLARRDEL